MTDNDHDYQVHCINKYSDYEKDDNIGIFYEMENGKNTFEVVLYDANKELCDSLFGEDAQAYMLNNKTEAAYQLMNCEEVIEIPNYIKQAIEWIKQ